MAVPKPRPQPPAGPSVVVIVPRAAFARWCAEPWEDVRAAAIAGDDGLRVATEAERLSHTTPADTAQLREGVGHYGAGKTMLFKQGW